MPTAPRPEAQTGLLPYPNSMSRTRRQRITAPIGTPVGLTYLGHSRSRAGDPPVGRIPCVRCGGVRGEVAQPGGHLPDLRHLEQRDRAVIPQPLPFGVLVGGSPCVRREGCLTTGKRHVQSTVPAGIPVG